MNFNYESTYSKHLVHWDLDTSKMQLNHGAFGATPKFVLEKQTEYRNEMERHLLRYFMRDHENFMIESKEKTGQFLGMSPHNFVFVQNATQGVNTILHSLSPEKDDEWLITSLNYGACVQTFKWYAQKYGVKLNTALINYPIIDENEIVENVLAAVTPNTRLILLDHITSATGIILPIEKIISKLAEKNITILVDGAHAPGMLPIDIEKLNADYYVGNAHKWICSPKGSAVLFVRPDRQNEVAPLQISHYHDRNIGTKNNWSDQFTMTGTIDYSPYRCVPTAIDFFENNFENGWQGVREYNRSLALVARNLLAEMLETSLPAPDNMIGNIANVLVNADVTPPAYGYNYSEGLQDKLYNDFGIEVPIFYLKNHRTGKTEQYVRIACQLYNSLEQYRELGEAIIALTKS